MRRKNKINLINSVILGRRSYRERLARLLLQDMLQTVDAELTLFAREQLARGNQCQVEPHCLFELMQHLGESNSWRTVCNALALRLNKRLTEYFKRPAPAVVVKAPVFTKDASAMLSSLYAEAALTRSASILAEHLLSNVWGSFHVPGISAIGNEVLSEMVNAGSRMLEQFDLSPDQVRAEQVLELRAALMGRLMTGVLQIRSEIALTLYRAIKEMNSATFIEKYDSCLREEPQVKGRAALRLAAD